MGRIGGVFIGCMALLMGGCASRPLDLAGSACTEREGPAGLVRICETPTQVTVEQIGETPAPVVARDDDGPKMLGLTRGRAAELLAETPAAAPASRKKDVCALDRKRLKQMLARKIARNLLADL